MSGTVLEHLASGKTIPEPLDVSAALELYDDAKSNPKALLAAASHMRDAKKGGIISFSKKVFVSVTTLCRDTCTYCTYKTEPRGDAFMSIDAIDGLLAQARRLGCVEALFVAGEHPEERYTDAADWLERRGVSSTAEYIAECSELAIRHGMFPHTNAGNLSAQELGLLRPNNASVGLMLETSSARLAERNMPHEGAPSKTPKNRIKALKDSGDAQIPTTTGILVGIGETPCEAVESLACIDEINKAHGHIQEVIVQNFQPKPDTPMRAHPAADMIHFMAIIAIARLMMPEMNIQAPPNLSEESYQGLLGAGINDWGGISPVTPDYVNPEFAWPAIRDVERRTQDAGFELRCRFAAYPDRLEQMPRRLYEMAQGCSDADGYVSRTRWDGSQ